jgi:hypothetical protein
MIAMDSYVVSPWADVVFFGDAADCLVGRSQDSCSQVLGIGTLSFETTWTGRECAHDVCDLWGTRNSRCNNGTCEAAQIVQGVSFGGDWYEVSRHTRTNLATTRM